MLKLMDNPPIMPAWAQSITQLSGQWWVGHTKARFEKVFAWNLNRQDIGYFLPLIERVRVSSGRKRRVLLPLFSSYVFFCGDEQDRLAAIKTNRLCRAIKVADQEKFLSELVNIERALLAKAKLDFYPFVAVGRRCRITAGYFEGIEGTVIHNNNTARIILEVSILGQGASMEVSADLLEPVD